MTFLKKNTIPILLFILVVTLSSLSFYNYNTQKHLLLEQMQSDAGDIVNSITAAMDRFHEIKSTMNLQRLVDEVSFDLEIFEFRYLEPHGTIRNSMFKEEIGLIRHLESFQKTMQGDAELGTFFFEERDYVPVMAIYYPIFLKGEMIGMIDLSVDISEYKMIDGIKPEFSLKRRQVDIMNLLKSIKGSIHNSVAVYEETDLFDFLYHYVESAENIVQITLVNNIGKVLTSSNNSIIGSILDADELSRLKLIEIDGRTVYRIVAENRSFLGDDMGQLVLLIDAAPYTQNEQQLLRTALITSAIAVLFALIIARAIYYSAIEQSRQEKEHLEKVVKERTHEIELLSKTDALTGLWNRGYLEELLDMEFKRARRYQHNITLLMVDLDHFKHVNDTYGHMAGDEVLRQASQRIKDVLRETDLVGRYGGEEIVVILPETTLENAQMLGNRVRQKIASEPVIFQEHVINITTSIGISNFRTEHSGYQEVFAEADQALYLAKEQGRDKVVLYQEPSV